MESAGSGPEVLLTVRCPRSHHVAEVLDTAEGAVYRSVVGSHAHGDRDYVDTGHGSHQRGTAYVDLLSAEDPRDDALPAGCECGPSTLSRARLRLAISAGERTVELAAAQPSSGDMGGVGEVAPPQAARTEPVRVSTGRYVSAAGAEYAREKIGHALTHAPAPVLSARVRLSGHGDPAVSSRVVAQAVADVGGRTVRVQVQAPTTREAVDLLQERLKARLAGIDRRGETIRRLRAHGEHEWRHGDAPRPQLPYYPRPPETREVVRHKSYALTEQTCGAAAADAEALDYDFHLFVEAGSGADSVLYRDTDGSYRLAQVDGRPEAVIADLPGMTTSPTPPPELTVEEAATRLEMVGQPFVFFRDTVLGRGCVLYHRYDGHLGLITPAGVG